MSQIRSLDSISSKSQNINQTNKGIAEHVPISVIILTKNEELFVERCIRSVIWADEYVVLDSGSTDKTKEIAASLGASVYHQDWLGWVPQRTKAISLAKHDWVFILEADEIVTPELAQSIQIAMGQPKDERDGYSMDRRDDFHGELMPNIRRSKKNRNFIRLFNRKFSAYDSSMEVHEEVRCPGKAIFLSGVLMHWRGWQMDDQVSALNRYATIESEVLFKEGKRANGLTILLRPVFRFFWCYIVKGTFRKGIRGFNYAMVRAISEYIRYIKLWELENCSKDIHPNI